MALMGIGSLWCCHTLCAERELYAAPRIRFTLAGHNLPSFAVAVRSLDAGFGHVQADTSR